MTEFYHPYQFVPATGKLNGGSAATLPYADIKAGEATVNARHDIWQKGTLSGRMICSVRLDSPTFIGQQRDSSAELATAKPFTRLIDGKPTCVLPGSSLRGMAGGVAEVLSQSALRVLDNRKMSVRKEVNQSLPAIGLINKGTRSEGYSSFTVWPLTFATQWKFDFKNKHFELPPKPGWGTHFKGRSLGDVLPAYLNGYRNGVAFGELKNLNPQSYPSVDQKGNSMFYYALLHKNLEGYDAGDKIPADEVGLYTKGSRLLGQRLREGTTKLPKLITEQHYKEQLTDVDRNQYTRGVIRVIDFEGKEDYIPPTKKHELFIPLSSEMRNSLPMTLKAIKAYNEICDDAMRREPSKLPLNLKGNAYQGDEFRAWQMAAGKLVYFDINDRGEVVEISLSNIWRQLLDDSIYDFFQGEKKQQKNLLPWNSDRKNLTPVEALWGVVEDEKDLDASVSRNLASRLRFSDALPSVGTQSNDQLDDAVILKILSSPKPPSPAMYFDDGSQKLIKKQELKAGKHQPNGRKVYLHHPDVIHDEKGKLQPWKTRDYEKNDALKNAKQKVEIQPLSKGQVFHFHIDFENLSEAELGLLKMSLEPEVGFRHRLGMGKAFGLGSVTVAIEGVFEIDRLKRYSTDGLDADRYSKIWRKPSEATPLWSVHYPVEATVTNMENLEGFAQDGGYWDYIDSDSLNNIRGAGNIASMRPGVPVSFPLQENQAAETEGFNWFVNNSPSGQNAPSGVALGAIKRGNIPTLKKNREKTKGRR